MIDKICWKNFIIDPHAIINEITSDSLDQSISEFLKWGLDCSSFNKEIKHFEIELPTGKFHRYETDLHSSKLHRDFLGIGRSLNANYALSKSFGECMERLVAFELFHDTSESIETYELKISDGSFKVGEISSEKSSFPKNVFSSNGWAFHFDPMVAIRNSVREALERHILLYTFLKDSWQGFSSAKGPTIEELSTESVFSKYSAAGYAAGMCLVHSNKHPGVLIGYTADTIDNISTSEGWIQAFFEAFEQAKYYEKHEAVKNENSIKYGYEFLQKNQLHFLRNSIESKFDQFDHQITSIQKSIQAKLLLVDIGKALGTSFPCYVSWVFGGSLLPLFVNDKLESNESRIFLKKILELNNIPSERINLIHPVL